MRSLGLTMALFCAAAPVSADAPAQGPQPGATDGGTPSAGTSHDGFMAVFGGPQSAWPDQEWKWQQYQTLPADKKATVDSAITKYNQYEQLAPEKRNSDPLKTQVAELVSQSQLIFGKAAADKSHADLGHANDVVNNAKNNTCPDGKLKTADGCASPSPSPAPQGPDQKTDPKKQAAAQDTTANTSPVTSPPPTPSIAGAPAPGPDTKDSTAAAKPDPAMQAMIKKGLLGALAGAAIGIGLLPLLGPIGILFAALFGIGIMLASHALGGSE